MFEYHNILKIYIFWFQVSTVYQVFRMKLELLAVGREPQRERTARNRLMTKKWETCGRNRESEEDKKQK